MAARRLSIILFAFLFSSTWGCRMAGEDFLVQHFEVTIGSGVASQDHTIPISIDPDHSRVMGSWTQTSTPVILESGSGSVDHAVHIVDGSTVRVLGDPSASYERTVRFTILSYVGTPGGPNEFTVYRLAFASTSWLNFERTFAQAGIPEFAYAKATLLCQGFVEDSNATMTLVDRNLGGAKIDDYTIAFNNNNIGPSAIPVRLELTDWNGSNWQVERHNTGPGREFSSFADMDTASGWADGITEIGDIGDWSNAWIEGHQARGDLLLHPGVDTTHVEVGLLTSSILPIPWGPPAFYVIRNPEIHVEHYGYDIGNSQLRWRSGTEALFPLPAGHAITLGPDKVFAAPLGYNSRWASAQGVYPLGEQEDLNVGERGYSAAYDDGVGVRIYRGATLFEPEGSEFREHIQVIQMAPSGVIPDTSLPGNVIDRPKVSVSFRSQ